MEFVYKLVPRNVLIGFLVFCGLMAGGYLVGSTDAGSTTPTYITDQSGSNSVTVSSHGHMSVHIADPNLPVISGPEETTRTPFPSSHGLSQGQCYEAFVRGAGTYLTASILDQKGSGGGRPDVLVRLDRAVVWLEDGSRSSTPIAPVSGVTPMGNNLIFAFNYSLKFTAFAGIDVCWHHPGKSDAFSVQLTLSGIAGGVLDPEEMKFSSQNSGTGTHVTFSHRWIRQPGNQPAGYRVAGTNSTQVSYYHRLGKLFVWQPYGTVYSMTVKASANHYLRYFVFEAQAQSDPTRVGPFGSWQGL